MKKSLSIVVALSLVLGTGIPAYAAKTPTKPPTKPAVKTPAKPAVKPAPKPVVKPEVKPDATTEVSTVGVIKAFTDTSITLIENGKTNTYSINENTKIINSVGENVELQDTAKKGLKVNLKATGKNATTIEMPNAGGEGLGMLGIAAVEHRLGVSDSAKAVVPKNSINKVQFDERTKLMNVINEAFKEKEAQEDDSIVYEALEPEQYEELKAVEKSVIKIGAVNIEPGTVKISLNGKELKVIEDAKKGFDPADKTDEVKIVPNGLGDYFTLLVFESPITTEELNAEKLESLVKISYKKKVYDVTTNELNSVPINEDVYAELNGKEVTLAKALHRGTNFSFTSNENGEIVYIDALYKDLECKVVSYDPKTSLLKINAYRFGNPSFDDTVKVADGVVVLNADGSEASLEEVLKASKIKITTDSAQEYEVVSVQIVPEAKEE